MTTGALGLLLVGVLIAANGIFVAAEFSLVSVRRTVVDDLAESGDRRARAVRRELSHLSFALSAAQFGITVTSLLVGYIAEEAVGDTLIRPLLNLIGVPEQAALGVALTGAFLLSTMLQMLLGELFPKNLAISRPLGVARSIVPLSRGFGIVLGPVIRIFDFSAEWVTRHLFRVEVVKELEGGHSLHELERIIAASGEEGSLSTEQTELLRRAVALGDKRVSEVMVPRPDITWLAADDTLSDLRSAARRTGHSRFPVRGDSEDDVLGTVHVKDLLAVEVAARDTTVVREVMADAFAVPESEPLRQLLTDFRREQRTFAVVVDEYGGTAGIITIEDLIEELVGEIEDEFDRSGHALRRVGAGRFLVPGTLTVDRLDALLKLRLPEGEYETVAGFLLDQLGRIPEPGDKVEIDGWELQVTRMQGVRIVEVSLCRDPRAASGDGQGQRS